MNRTSCHKTKRVYMVLAVLSGMLSGGTVSAEDPVPQAWLDMRPVSAWHAGEMDVTILVEWTGAPESVAVLPVEMPEVEGVVWRDQTFSSEFDGERSRTVQKIVLVASERTGTIEIPEIRVKYRLPGEEENREVTTPSTTVTIKSYTVSATVAAGFLAIAVLAGAVWLGLKVRGRRRSLDNEDESVAEEADRLEQDLAALSRLKLAGDYGAYFMGLIRIAREVDPDAVRQTPLNEVTALVESARYGGYRPDNDLAERSFRAVERLIKKSRNTQVSEGG